MSGVDRLDSAGNVVPQTDPDETVDLACKEDADDVILPRDDDVIGDVTPPLSDTAQAVVLPTTAELLPNESGSSATALVVEVVQGGLLGDARVGTRARR